MKNIMIVAAEASSATYAIKLIQYWRAEKKDYKFFGAGSQEMEDLGFERLGKSEEMAVVGASEIINAYAHLKSVFNRLVEEATLRRPEVVILMDYPEFNLFLAKKLHALGLNVVYYISPQVWAWRQGRVHTIKKYCKEVYLLFPFEVDFYKKHGVPHEFVGHPILDEIDPKYLDDNFITLKKNKMGIQSTDFVLALMPGSRRLELKNHMQLQMECAREVKKKYPNVQIVVLVAPTFTKEQVQDAIGDFNNQYILIKDEPAEMISIADLVLVASGTATLMVGLLQKPMVIMYKMQWLTYFFAKAFIRGVKFFGLVNLIFNQEVVPERWQFGANKEEITKLLFKFIEDRKYYDKVRTDLKKIEPYLGHRGATQRVAQSLEKYLK